MYLVPHHSQSISAIQPIAQVDVCVNLPLSTSSLLIWKLFSHVYCWHFYLRVYVAMLSLWVLSDLAPINSGSHIASMGCLEEG